MARLLFMVAAMANPLTFTNVITPLLPIAKDLQAKGLEVCKKERLKKRYIHFNNFI